MTGTRRLWTKSDFDCASWATSQVSEEDTGMERIGVVLVHGIGEQGRFEHLSNEVRDLLTALDADP